MKMQLCRPCAMGMLADNKKLKQESGRSEKITCAKCGRRRFGVTYEITERANASRREDTEK